ncbi:MAG: MurR/RpiR family transcriptional regulator [Alphaproteobacteria bacterium]|nr:MurR/RpiR family transcriptional regulator [Alphaproteobacteria bacterium]
MNDTDVPYTGDPHLTAPVLGRIVDGLSAMSPQLRKAAQYVLDNPTDVGVSSIREIAIAAQVKPNTLVRMARAVGFDGYDDMRAPFREALRTGRESFPDRARWLQSIARGERFGGLMRDMAASVLANVEALYAGIDAAAMKGAADRIVAARHTYVLGLGVSHALAHNIAYLAHMALDSVTAIPRDGSLPVDDLVTAGRHDVLIAMTFAPYRSEVVSAVEMAKEQGMAIIAVTDSLGSPIALGADHAFVVPTETPQFFTSTVAAAALLETLVAFVVAEAGTGAVRNIERMHDRRQRLGVYY